MIEVIGGALGVAEVVHSNGEDVFAKLHFQHDAGGGEGDAELGEITFGFHLAVAGGGVTGFESHELGEQFGPVVIFEALGIELGVGGTSFGKFVAHAALTLADGGAEEFQHIVLGDGAADLGGQVGGAGGEFVVEGIERGFRRGEKCGEVGRPYKFPQK